MEGLTKQRDQAAHHSTRQYACLISENQVKSHPAMLHPSDRDQVTKLNLVPAFLAPRSPPMCRVDCVTICCLDFFCMAGPSKDHETQPFLYGLTVATYSGLCWDWTQSSCLSLLWGPYASERPQSYSDS
jgi:hypothetical protein